MTAVKREITYYSAAGPNNTERTLRLAKDRGDALGLRTVIVGSTTGETGLAVARLFDGYRVVVVSHAAGYQEPNTQEMSSENSAAIREAGAHILTAQHAFGGVGRAVRIKLGTYEVDEIVAYTLRILGQGMKVCLELTAMATDAGLAHTGEEVVVIAGTGRGSDTAVVVRAANTMRFFDLAIPEIICMPGGVQAQ